jgi:hypothetical protein
MPSITVLVCQCPVCQAGTDHPDKARHHQINLLMSRLDEPQRRWYAAIESERLGYGGDRLLSQISGLDEQTIRRGRQELATGLTDHPAPRRRAVGGGRRQVEKKIR